MHRRFCNNCLYRSCLLYTSKSALTRTAALPGPVRALLGPARVLFVFYPHSVRASSTLCRTLPAPCPSSACVLSAFRPCLIHALPRSACTLPELCLCSVRIPAVPCCALPALCLRSGPVAPYPRPAYALSAPRPQKAAPGRPHSRAENAGAERSAPELRKGPSAPARKNAPA